MRRSFIAVTGAAVVVALAVGTAPSRASDTSDLATSATSTASATAPNTTAAGDGVIIETKFVSSLGWVKPGEGYPFRVLLHNATATPVAGAAVSIPAPDGVVFLHANDPTATVSANQITWAPGPLAAGTTEAPTTIALVVEARAEGLGEDAQIVWKDLSVPATLTYTGGPAAGVTSTSHGPKVIPPDPSYDTARYGDRPFPVVPVAYVDRAPEASAEQLAQKLNDPSIPGSTFNLYQELSFGQLFPQGSVSSAGIATADFTYEPGFQFSSLDPATTNTCTGGATFGAAPGLIGTPVYPERIVDGWYQLPGNTAYYGADANGSALVGAVAGVGALQAIDSGCGPTGKAVYDAAQIADPEIDYDDFDTDKDGVVDFFMMVFTGLGGNGDSQLNGVPPYDNIWPHSSSLEFGYVDPVTGLGGFATDDQLHDLEGVAQCWVDDSYVAQDACAAESGTGDDGLPVQVRVGPYNVNPESAVEHASVISHEYGHSLGLPDFYSTGSRETYGDFTLMATDKSQGMDVFARQDLGWVVPSPLESGTYSDLPESDTDIHHIDWKTPSGVPYALSGPGVHNGPAWMAKLPRRQILDPALVAEQASASHVWWSQSGNDFGCSPTKGHNLDVYLPELATVAAGTDVSLTFKSYFDIEWDYDYGFVMVSTDGGDTFTALESQNGYTTPATQNPNANPCQATYGNGVTGTGSSYDAGTAAVDRVLGDFGPAAFVDDAYDLSPFAGEEVVLRFSYATDPGLARPGWFIDDAAVTAGGTEVYSTDFESSGTPTDERMFNGGCREGLGTRCTKGWQYADASAGSPADHGYYLEVRDRSGFDNDGKGENDRDPIGFEPGLLLVYTDEAHGYGNVGTDNPPAQSPLDSQPEPGSDTPNLNDATFTARAGDSHFADGAWMDNYSDPSREEVCVSDCDNPLLASSTTPWLFDFDCLSFDVTSMAGDAVGPVTSPGDLTAGLDVDLGPGCVPFDYGSGHLENQAPTAVAQAKATTVRIGEKVRLDASGSNDDLGGPSVLSFAWDTDGDGTNDAMGPTASPSFDEAGEHIITLTVTDSSGLSATDAVTITVEPKSAPGKTSAAGPSQSRTTEVAPRVITQPIGATRVPATSDGAGAVLAALSLAALGLVARRLLTAH